MHLPATTGYVAQALGCTEPRLNDLIRRGRIAPAPPVMLGRRLWSPVHVLQAARALGVLDDDLRAEIERESFSAASASVSQVQAGGVP
jgi:hypothetical protein